MKTNFFGLIIILFVTSCSEEQRGNDELFDYDRKTGVLTISDDILLNSNIHLKKINIQSNSDNFSQEIILDSNLIVNDVISYKDVFWKDKYKNNWIALDNQGNLKFKDSYFYETFVDFKDDSVVIECTFQNYLGNVQYLLLGDLDEQYKFKSKIDTFYFDDNNSAYFIDRNAKYGKNIVRFIIVDEKKSGKEVRQNKIYGAKEYILIK
ncbi:MAG: hypothetical protein ACK44B_00345 [Flavobacteriales bacterium]|jgi:hypothetical protein